MCITEARRGEGDDTIFGSHRSVSMYVCSATYVEFIISILFQYISKSGKMGKELVRTCISRCLTNISSKYKGF